MSKKHRIYWGNEQTYLISPADYGPSWYQVVSQLIVRLTKQPQMSKVTFRSTGVISSSFCIFHKERESVQDCFRSQPAIRFSCWSLVVRISTKCLAEKHWEKRNRNPFACCRPFSSLNHSKTLSAHYVQFHIEELWVFSACSPNVNPNEWKFNYSTSPLSFICWNVARTLPLIFS